MTSIRDPAPTGRLRPTLLALLASLLIFSAYTRAADGQAGTVSDEPTILPQILWPATVVLVSLLATLAYWFKRSQPAPPTRQDRALTRRELTQSFISAIPTLTRQLNLEVATTTQTEVLERSESSTLLWGWINLGTNQARIRVQVTYRYHLCLKDPWQLELCGSTLRVTAPPLRASQPPAIHTDQMEVWTSRGWCRFSPTDLLDQLHRDLTPTLIAFAADERRIDLVRDACRQSVAEFVQRWLEGQPEVERAKFKAITVQFTGEQQLQTPPPTLKLLGP